MTVKDFLEVCDISLLVIADSNNTILYSEAFEEIGDLTTLESLKNRTIDIISADIDEEFDNLVFYIKLK